MRNPSSSLFNLKSLALLISAGALCSPSLAQTGSTERIEEMVITADGSQVLLQWPSKWIFWGVILAAMILAQWRDRHPPTKRWLLGLTSAGLVLLALGHTLRFGADAFTGAAPGINAGLLLAALALALMAWRQPAR